MAAFLTSIGAALGIKSTVAATIVGAGVTAGTAVGGTKLLKSAFKPETPKLPSLKPEDTPSISRAEAEAEAKITKRRRAIARNRTIFTDPLGLSPAERSAVATKTLTGQ